MRDVGSSAGLITGLEQDAVLQTIGPLSRAQWSVTLDEVLIRIRGVEGNLEDARVAVAPGPIVGDHQRCTRLPRSRWAVQDDVLSLPQQLNHKRRALVLRRKARAK